MLYSPFSDSMITWLSRDRVTAVLAANIQFESGTAYVHSGTGTLVLGGFVYYGMGTLGAIDDVSETNTTSPTQLKMTLSGLDMSLFAKTLNERCVGKPAELYLVAMDDNGVVQVADLIFKGRVTVGTSGWVTPTIAGFDRSKYLVCCKWNSPYTLDYDGNRLLFLNDGSNTEDQPMSGTVDVVIFAGGVSPVAANPGFNIYNAAGQCTFSTARRPFVYLGVNFVPSTTAQTVPGGGYVPVGRFGLRVPSFGGGRIYHYHYGLVMQNGTLRAGRGLYVGWADRQLANAGVTPISLPVIPDMYV